MRFSLITITFALALTANASPVNKRELSPSVAKCAASLTDISGFLPSFISSVKKISSYASVIDTYAKDHELEGKLKKALKDCKKVTYATEEEVAGFSDPVKDMVKKIRQISNEFSKKKNIIDGIPLVRPILEKSLSNLNHGLHSLEDHLIDVCPESYKEEFQGYVDEINDAMNDVLDTYEIDE